MKQTMLPKLYFPIRIIYTIVTIITFLLIVAVVFFMLWAIITPIGASITPIANSFHNSSWSLYDTLNNAETFMTYFWQYLLIFALFGLAYWVYMYNQRRGQPY